ncbi:MAG: sigma-54 dependent transcriptional regulator [Pseudomonadota bacterium]
MSRPINLYQNDGTAIQSISDEFDVDIAQARVLIVDDEPGIRNFLFKALREYCAAVETAENTEEASKKLDETSFDVIILDNVMPKVSGLEWLAEQKRIGLLSDTILITAFADLDTAISAIRAGASDFLLKPFRINQILNALGQSMARSRLRRQNSLLRYELETGKDLLRHRDALIGVSEAMNMVRRMIERAANTPAHVVIRGEAGSGKQIAARMLHSNSAQAQNPFVWIQCKAMTEEGFQARLFGRVEDMNHGSVSGEEGILINAAGGTLFLEDVELLTPACQNILTELLSTGRFRPLGAERSFELDMRVISSTTAPLKDTVEAGAFRTDLFYLLNVAEIAIPALRERPEDILELLNFFAQNLAKQMGLQAPVLDPIMRRRYLAHHWPGNVMELRNTVERALIVGEYQSPAFADKADAEHETLAVVERRHVLKVLDACGGNRAEAARQLGLARKTIDRKCQAWGL